MKKTALIVTLLATTVCRSQQTMQPIAPPARPSLPINRPIVVNGNGNVVTIPTNEPGNTMETNPAETNELGATNSTAAETNAYNPELASAYALTNRLSVMAPAQVLVVRQVQAGLSSLQDVAMNINEQEGLLVAIQHNPQIQHRVDEVSDHIINLTHGDVKPSRDSVDRISLDLLRASSHARLPDDHEMILAIVINLTSNSEKLSAADLDDTVNIGVMILHADGVAPAICNAFGCDLRSIALELQPNLGI
jgi:hypothetical protein